MELSLGIDFGTSGARIVAIAPEKPIDGDRPRQYPIQWQYDLAFGLGEASTVRWRGALFELLAALPPSLAQSATRIAINGTSGTVLLCDRQGRPQTEPLLYNDDRAQAVLPQVRALAPPAHPVCSATSSLAKLLWWQQTLGQIPADWQLFHQADWLGSLLHGQSGCSDYHNALKLGYDPAALAYPDWLWHTPWRLYLPAVVAPGQAIAPITEAIAQRFGLNPACRVCAGTTDSIAAFLASGVDQPGEAVTSLGSTLVLKLLSETRVDHATYGVYSHRLGDRWLVGGASNTGGAVLRRFFSDSALVALSQQIDPAIASPLVYYPLNSPGDRFPIADPQLPPCLTPRPADDVAFLHGLLESMARIEAEGYGRLQALGATPLQRVVTAGGGAQNGTWQQIRQRHLQVPVVAAVHGEAAYGTALLAAGAIAGLGATEDS